jgi:hypothetical protein
MSELKGKNVAMVLAPQFEDSEAIDPKNYLEERGAKVTVIGLEKGTIEGKKGGKLDADTTFDSVNVGQFDALVIPGGKSANPRQRGGIHTGVCREWQAGRGYLPWRSAPDFGRRDPQQDDHLCRQDSRRRQERRRELRR